MHLVEIRSGEAAVLAERGPDGVRELSDRPLGELLAEGVDPSRLAPRGEWRALAEDERLDAPLRPGQILAMGLNYADHIREAGVEPPDRPVIFAKLPSAVIGPEQPIVIDRRVCDRVDWEVELAVVIGTRLRDADRDAVAAGIFGYTVANDVSARDVQFAEPQWLRAKSFDTFCPIGPAVVTADAVADPQALSLRTRVNGETVQDSSTAEMLVGVHELVAYCSRGITLSPGDLILTGTPWGCGEFMDPPRSLRQGDRVEVEIDGIGLLGNPVEEIGAA